jgi:hypothetical protein
MARGSNGRNMRCSLRVPVMDAEALHSATNSVTLSLTLLGYALRFVLPA